jgi:hypothetical protein
LPDPRELHAHRCAGGQSDAERGLRNRVGNGRPARTGPEFHEPGFWEPQRRKFHPPGNHAALFREFAAYD